MTQETSLNHWVSPFSHQQTKVTQILQSVMEMSNQKCSVRLCPLLQGLYWPRHIPRYIQPLA